VVSVACIATKSERRFGLRFAADPVSQKSRSSLWMAKISSNTFSRRDRAQFAVETPANCELFASSCDNQPAKLVAYGGVSIRDRISDRPVSLFVLGDWCFLQDLSQQIKFR
jgi:hypothetical protein